MWRGLQPAASRLVSMPDALKSSPQERGDESRRGRLKCPRHENQVVAGTHRLRAMRGRDNLL